jgi:hypothetical protein
VSFKLLTCAHRVNRDSFPFLSRPAMITVDSLSPSLTLKSSLIVCLHLSATRGILQNEACASPSSDCHFTPTRFFAFFASKNSSTLRGLDVIVTSTQPLTFSSPVYLPFWKTSGVDLTLTLHLLSRAFYRRISDTNIIILENLRSSRPTAMAPTTKPPALETDFESWLASKAQVSVT